jgi:hypothetical protein
MSLNSTSKEKKTMYPDPRTNPVTARVIFEGVMLMCINQLQQYEVGMIQCPLHQPKINIVESTIGFDSKEHDIVWPEGHDLVFRVNNPETEGVTLFQNPGSATDFSKVIDLESPAFHADGVTVETELLQGRRLVITAGTVYSHKLSDVEFDLLTWENENEIGTPVGTALGHIADQIGIKIACRDEPLGGIDLVDYTTGTVIESLSKRNTSYVITINNDCRQEDSGPEGPLEPVEDPGIETGPPPPEPTNGTDFRFYYGLLSSTDGRKFDLSIRVEDEDEDEEETGPAPSPGACEATFLGQTDGLGLYG